MKRFILTVLAALGVLGALAATTSATATQAALAGMLGIAAVGLVVLLEVINVSGTWVWLTDTRTHVRWEAGVGVGVASLVTGACGLLTYGLLGAVAPAGLLFAVHLVFRLNQPATSATPPTAQADPALVDVAAGPAPLSDTAEPVHDVARELGIEVKWDQRPCSVYHLFDKDDRVLYVGVAFDVAERMTHHRNRKEWWSEVECLSFTTYGSRAEALAVEREEIARLEPVYNVMPGGVGDGWTGLSLVDQQVDAVEDAIDEGNADRTDSLVQGHGGRTSATWTDEEIIADLDQRGETATVIQRTIRDRYKAGPRKANRILDVIQPNRAVETAVG